MINVFMIDDHFAIIQGLEFSFSDCPEGIRMTGSSLNLQEALTRIPSLDVQVILLDLFLEKEKNPVDNVRKLKAAFPVIPIIIYTAENSVFWKLKMYEEGVSGFLYKGSDLNTVFCTIQLVMEGNIMISPELLKMVSAGSDETSFVYLTTNELRVGQYIADGLTLKEIAGKEGKSVSAIEKCSRQIRKKTATKTLPESIKKLITYNQLSVN